MNDSKPYWVKFKKNNKQEIKWFAFLETRNIFLVGLMKSDGYTDIEYGRVGA